MATVMPAERHALGGWGNSPKGARAAAVLRRSDWIRLAIKWSAAVKFQVPIGYQNETGFHYGKMAEDNDSRLFGENV